MSDIELQNLIGTLLSSMSFEVSSTKVTEDGIDFVVLNRKPFFKGKYIIQYKRWPEPIGESIVKDLYSAVISEGGSKGIIITNTYFTKNSFLFAEGKPIELIDGYKLIELINRQGMGLLFEKKGMIQADIKCEQNLIDNILMARNETLKEPANLRLKIKLICKCNIFILAFARKKYSLSVLREFIRISEDSLLSLASECKANDMFSVSIRLLSYAQLGSLKILQGQFDEGIRYAYKTVDLHDANEGLSIGDPQYYGKLNKLFIENMLNIISMTNHIGESKKAHDLYQKYKSRIIKYITDEFYLMQWYIEEFKNHEVLKKTIDKKKEQFLNQTKIISECISSPNTDIESSILKYIGKESEGSNKVFFFFFFPIDLDDIHDDQTGNIAYTYLFNNYKLDCEYGFYEPIFLKKPTDPHDF